MSDRTTHLSGTLGGDDSPSFEEVDAYVAGLEDSSGMPGVVERLGTAAPSARSDRDFTDPITGATCAVVDTPDGMLPHGIRHPGCERLADPCPEFDAFYCMHCGHNGRVAGGWLLELAGKG